MSVSTRRPTKGFEARTASTKCHVQSMNLETDTEAKTGCLLLGVGAGVLRTNNANLYPERKLKPAQCLRGGTIYRHPSLPGSPLFPGGCMLPCIPHLA